MTSYHPRDVQHGYCGNCHEFPFVADVLVELVGTDLELFVLRELKHRDDPLVVPRMILWDVELDAVLERLTFAGLGEDLL
jgi:hypothetical protein